MIVLRVMRKIQPCNFASLGNSVCAPRQLQEHILENAFFGVIRHASTDELTELARELVQLGFLSLRNSNGVTSTR